MGSLLPWLSLKSVPGLTNQAYLGLLEHFGSPSAVLEAPAADLVKAKAVSTKLADAIARHSCPGWVYAELEAVEKQNYTILTLDDPGYPRLLRHIADPPPVLYVRGKLCPRQPSVAVVGSRKATSYGLNAARKIAGGLAEHGWTIVSGMALGIDSAAHKAALAAGKETIAVLGTGLDVIYPRQNAKLYNEIAESGALVSEFFLDTEPRGHHFPVRNRIISGLCYGTVVVEAARRSGALITARLALEQGRDVFAVPGSIESPSSRGTNFLIRQGAHLVENADQVTAELADQLDCGLVRTTPEVKSGTGKKTDVVELSAAERKILDLIGAEPVHIDEIAVKTDAGTGELASILLHLELKGAVVQRPGKFFQRP